MELISEKINKEVIKISLGDNLDIYNGTVFNKEIEKILYENSCNIIFSFNNVHCIDSSGLSFLVQMYKILQSQSKKLVIIQANRLIKKELEITRLNKIFSIEEDEESALTELGFES